MAITSNSQTTISSSGRFNNFSKASEFRAFGGVISESGGYKIHTFESSGEFEVISGVKRLEVFIVSGGGGGGSGSPGGGGGGGGISQQQVARSITPGKYAMLVGAGGSADSDGSESSAFGASSSSGLSGGSQSDSVEPRHGGTSGNGFIGGNGHPNAGGGGGGAVAEGVNGTHILHSGSGNNRRYRAVGGNAGAGETSSFSGASLSYGGGGGGGPLGGGSTNQTVNGTSYSQAQNLGGGGFRASSGYSGVVIVRYAI